MPNIVQKQPVSDSGLPIRMDPLMRPIFVTAAADLLDFGCDSRGSNAWSLQAWCKSLPARVMQTRLGNTATTRCQSSLCEHDPSERRLRKLDVLA